MVVGRHSKVHFWTNNWLGSSLIDLIDDHSSLQPLMESFMGDIYSDTRGWDLSSSFHSSHPTFAFEIERVVVSFDLDSLVCTCSLDGVISCKTIYISLSDTRV